VPSAGWALVRPIPFGWSQELELRSMLERDRPPPAIVCARVNADDSRGQVHVATNTAAG
jgi:hypothetical protein